MKIWMMLISIVCCAATGMFWAFALNINILIGFIAGCIIGVPTGLFAGFLLKIISKMSNTTAKFLSTILILPTIFFLLLCTTGIGLIMWLIRIIFS